MKWESLKFSGWIGGINNEKMEEERTVTPMYPFDIIIFMI